MKRTGKNGNRKVLRPAALLLALSLVLALAGCASSGSAEETAAAETKESVSAETEAETAAAAEEETEEEGEEEVVIDYRDIDVEAMVAAGQTIVYADTYGVYSMEGDAVDSSIKTTVYCDLDTGDVVYIEFEEALIPYSLGGAAGWGILDEDVAALLGDDVLTADTGTYPLYFSLGGLTWTGALSDGDVIYTAEVNGEEEELIAYVSTPEGGAWYHDSRTEGADILTADGETVANIEIGTKASIGHGVSFWASAITFPGNLERIKNYVYDYGTDYDYAPDGDDMEKNEDGVWVVADVVTGATLAGTPNYLNLIKEACEAIEAGEYTVLE